MSIKKSMLIIVWLLAFANGNAAEKDDYSIYHAEVARAEELASHKEFGKALEIYDHLFKEYSYVFLRDCKVATQLAFYLEDERKTFDYLRLGIAKGWTLKRIKKEKFLKPLQKSEEWATIEQEYNSIREKYTKRLNHDLRAEVHKMFKKDQRLAIGALFRIGQKAQDRYAERKFAPNSRQQLMRLDSMLEAYGYPGEKLTGNSYWAETILSHSNSISRKHAQQDTVYNYLRPKLISALRRGEISPYELALIDNWKMTVESGWMVKSYSFLADSLTEEELMNANRLRSQLGLRSVEARNRLIDIQEETGINFYLPGWPKPNGKIAITLSGR